VDSPSRPSSLEAFRLDGRVAIVTGANRGLGLAIAAALADAGADVVSVQRSPDSTAVRAAVEGAGRRFLAATVDVGRIDAPVTALDATLEAFGRADILVNNAGVQRRSPAEDFPATDWDLVLNVNLSAVFRFAQHFGRYMLAHGGGKIVNIASLIALQGGYTIAAYSAAKHGVAGITQTLCNEWAARGINVNAVAPGYMATEMNAALIADPLRSTQIGARIPAGRWGEPADIGGAVVFLASAAADYIHGQMLAVDGGWLAR
jgi:2-deoxy-D-gluconate 3-dehydrogenase